MLVDSGSMHSFVSLALAADCPGMRRNKIPMKVKIPDGGILCCDQELPNCTWKTQGQEFCTNLRLLPLGCYDIVLGMDWLQMHSPMNVHWGEKQLTVVHHGSTITLHGIHAKVSECATISVSQLEALERQHSVCNLVHLCAVKDPSEQATILEVVQPLLKEFAGAFAEPQGLPPKRPIDHSIPLLPGARPVNLQPYHCSPEQKDEIETQVAEMLRQGVIRFSSSPFASPMLLVQKKDDTW